MIKDYILITFNHISFGWGLNGRSNSSMKKSIECESVVEKQVNKKSSTKFGKMSQKIDRNIV